MINSEFAPGTAILALKIVALEYILAGKINALIRGVDISIKADHRWHWVALCDRVKPVTVCRPHQFTFVQKDKNKGALYGANHQGAVILIKHQYSAVHFDREFLETQRKPSSLYHCHNDKNSDRFYDGKIKPIPL